MERSRSDPLVTVLRFIIGFIIGAVGFALVMLAAGFVAAPFFAGDVGSNLAKEGLEIAPWQAIALIEVLLAAIIALLVTVEFFFVLLWRVLGSISEGDPFVPANSRRITQMAWTALAGNLWAIVLTAYAAWLERFSDHIVTQGDINFSFGGGGLVLILVLFVLARVFRHGTELRDDLEGTV